MHTVSVVLHQKQNNTHCGIKLLPVPICFNIALKKIQLVPRIVMYNSDKYRSDLHRVQLTSLSSITNYAT